MCLSNLGDKQLAFLASNWFRLTDLIISSVFITFTGVASLLFVQLENRLEPLKDADGFELSMGLNEWKGHYDLVCRLMDCINDVFGVILLVNISQIVFDMIIWCCALCSQFWGITNSLYGLEEGNDDQNLFGNMLAAFSHVFLRHLILSGISISAKNKVKMAIFYSVPIYKFNSLFLGQRFVGHFVRISLPFVS